MQACMQSCLQMKNIELQRALARLDPHAVVVVRDREDFFGPVGSVIQFKLDENSRVDLPPGSSYVNYIRIEE